MCFSTEASFISSGFLVVTGIFCVIRALKIKNYFFLALTPFFFGIQQFAEGMVWVGINHHNDFLTNFFSIVYLFFAFCFWLIWFPVVALSEESVKWKKQLFIALILIGLIFGLYLWIPVLLMHGPRKLVDTAVCGHSICYQLAEGGFLSGVVREYIYGSLGLLYLICSDILFKKFWAIVLLSALATILINIFAAASVWCFFSAAASLIIYFLIY